jgi:hypothetical protein
VSSAETGLAVAYLDEAFAVAIEASGLGLSGDGARDVLGDHLGFATRGRRLSPAAP